MGFGRVSSGRVRGPLDAAARGAGFGSMFALEWNVRPRVRPQLRAGVVPNLARTPSVPDLSHAPFLLVWEFTRACALACQHCRAAAIDKRDPDELTTAEGQELLRQTAAMGTPICVLTGGDPVQRPDLEELIHLGTAVGLRMATIPAATERLTHERLASLARAGVAPVALRIDAPDAAVHDAFRGASGSFASTVQAAHEVRGLGLPFK